MAVRLTPSRGRARRAPRRGTPQKGITAKGGVNFPVVAIGASAGGLEAFRTLLAALPASGSMAFVLVQHLDPTHPSMMVELLSAQTAMKLLEAREDMRLESDHVYVIPPGRYLAIRDGAIHLSRLGAHQSVRMSFDFLLQSLAEEYGERAVCIILSGTGTDGSIGAKAIKEKGGLVVAQDPEEAEYDGMPRSAIATGAVDLVLPLAKIPEAVAKYGGHRYVRTGKRDAAPPLGAGFAKIIDLLHKKTSHDFVLYKEAMIERRIERRMALAGIEDSERYLELLTKDPAELQDLANDLLINVTRFFRDSEAFDLLAKKIVPDLVRAHPPNQPIRIWVAGCSTGEEACSIAMLFLEEIAVAQRDIKLQIFATDIDEGAIAVAREGFYPASIEVDVPAPRLIRFFTKEDRGYRVSAELRRSIVFSVHDLLCDAPFSRLDLIGCRNLLIYLRSEVQNKVLSLFHFALREGGILFLGPSETVGDAGDQFDPISKTQRIYRRIGRNRPGEVGLPLGRGSPARSLWLRPARPPTALHTSVSDLTQRLVLESYAPASVLINRKHQGLYYLGATDRYLKMPTGEGSLDLLASAREGLQPAIRAAIEQASQAQKKISVPGRVRRNGDSTTVTVIAQPINSDGEELVLLSFLDSAAQEQKSEAAIESPAEASRTARLEEELDATRKDLESAVRDREIAEEEIRAINEEAMSVNEEFQTTNEELETSKEELQSLNEELTALNSQLQETLKQHQATADDLQNILRSADIATLFLDENLKIRFFTPATKSLFSVRPSDIGRPLADLAPHFSNENLLDDARAVLSNLVPVTREIETEAETATGAWYTCRVLPYRTKDDHIKGVVITFVDVTFRKHAEDALTAAKLQAESANLGKSRFLAAASHDLRQPLQTLVLVQGVLAKKLADRDELQLLARADAAVMAMSSMLNTLLDINQLETGVIQPEIVNFPINDLLEPLKAEFAYQMLAHSLDWRVLPCGLTVLSDPRLLKQMIGNLLSNALKYTRNGGVLLGCRRRGDKLRIEVWDTGLGIPEGQLRAIFTEFHQIDNPARELSRGLGLGLAIVQRLGDLLDHTVNVRSRHGRGSVFSVEVALAPKTGRVAPKGIERKPEEIRARSGSILIIEDDPALRDSLELALRTNGHRTVAAADGEAAIELVARKVSLPEIVIADFNLPGRLNGIQAITRMSEILGHDLPALVLTGDISTDTLHEIAARGYLHRSKPIGPDALMNLVQRLLVERGSTATRHPRSSPPREDGEGGPVIFVVDDDGIVRESMRDLLRENGRTVKVYASGEAFFEAYRSGGEGCLLIDAMMPGMSGFAVLERLKREGRPLAAIMITGKGDVRMAVGAIQAGAVDFIEKPVGETELLASIDHALEVTRDATKLSAWRDAAAKRLAGLTERQRQILNRVLDGQLSKTIAAELGISQRTVENHRAEIMRKTGAKSLAELIRLAVSS
jgi:two-component system, chemotaxis family, CheB/CheR fusion protein